MPDAAPVRRVRAVRAVSPEASVHELAAALEARPTRSRTWREFRRAIVRDFIAFAERRGVTTLGGVDAPLARAWVEWLAEPKRDGSLRKKKTLDVYAQQLKCAWRELFPDERNPFAGIEVDAVDGDVLVSRRPFTPEEVAAIVALAEKEGGEDGGIIVAGLCTGLRRGDLCDMAWSQIDLARNLVTVRTQKTRAVVDIPILPEFRRYLDANPQSGGGEWVFPEFHALHGIRNDHGRTTLRIQNFFVRALAPGVARRKAKDGTSLSAMRRKVCMSDRAIGCGRANRLGFHALRTTFITLAISGGIPADKLRAITGHKAVDMIYRHYFKPTGESLRDALAAAMPAALTSPGGTAPVSSRDGLPGTSLEDGRCACGTC